LWQEQKGTFGDGSMNIEKDSLIGLYSIGGHWVLLYPSQEEDKDYEEAVFSGSDEGIIELLYEIKESGLGHFNGKHNDYNIIIKRQRVKK
jgi:hypothetical protein